MWALAWKNLTHDRLRFVATTLGIAFSAFLMVFQGSLLYGFSLAASRVVDATDTDIWVTARGVRCFDFGTPIETRVGDLIAGIPGVERVGRLATGWVTFQEPDGVRQMIMLVGVDRTLAGRVPHPRVVAPADVVRQSLSVDASTAALLGVRTIPTEVEINSARGQVVHVTTGFESFLGAPYVFADHDTAIDYLSLPPERTLFVIVKTDGADIESVRDLIARRLPELDVWTTEEFALQSRIYWLVQTGAGGALSLAALLGFLIGVAVVSQAIYATTMEHLEEFATLKALGASPMAVRRVVALQSLACGLAGAAIGFSAVNPAADLTSNVVSWISTPWWLYVATGSAIFLMCILASVIAVRPAISVEPARVFRA